MNDATIIKMSPDKLQKVIHAIHVLGIKEELASLKI
jgi:hypothetical protein